MGSLLTASPTNTVTQSDPVAVVETGARASKSTTPLPTPRPRVIKTPRYIIGGAGNYRVPTFR